jgi:hypothetical protein
MACGLALLASGQAFATLYYSTSITASPTSEADFTFGTKWSTANTTCNAAANSAAAGGTLATAGNDFYICNTHTLTLSANYTFDGTWFGLPATGGIINLNGRTLTFSASPAAISTWYSTSGGSITSGNIVFNGTDGRLQGGAVDNHTVNHVTAAGTLASVTNGGFYPKIEGNVTVGGNVTGSLRFTDASHSITSTASAITVDNLNLGLISTARTINFVPAAAVGSSITVTGFIAPTATVALVCSGGVATGALGTGSSTTSISSGYTSGSYICTKSSNTVSAPIDLNMNKPVESYSTEIELK